MDDVKDDGKVEPPGLNALQKKCPERLSMHVGEQALMR